MPEAVDMTGGPGGEREVLAGELALGVLEGEELAGARRLVLADRDFADEVRWWNFRFARMAEEAGSVEPGDYVWPAIERRVREDGGDAGVAPVAPDTTVVPLRPKGYSGWSLAAAMAGAAAVAAAITVLVARPSVPEEPRAPVVAEAPAPVDETRLVAQLQSEDGAISLASLVEEQAGTISLNIAGLEPGSGQSAELWVVPEGGSPYSLGAIPATGDFSRDLTAEERRLLVPGASLAVTYEDATSIPNSAPSTDILVVSALAQV